MDRTFYFKRLFHHLLFGVLSGVQFGSLAVFVGVLLGVTIRFTSFEWIPNPLRYAVMIAILGEIVFIAANLRYRNVEYETKLGLCIDYLGAFLVIFWMNNFFDVWVINSLLHAGTLPAGVLIVFALVCGVFAGVVIPAFFVDRVEDKINAACRIERTFRPKAAENTQLACV